jgi:hypothetical protein
MPTRCECPDPDCTTKLHPKGEACRAVPLYRNGVEMLAGWVTVEGSRRCPGCKLSVIAAIRQAQAISNEDHRNLGLQTQERRGWRVYRDTLDDD